MSVKKAEEAQITIGAEVANLPVMHQFVDLYLEKLDCDMNKMLQVEVATEEFFVNIAKYAYGDGEGTVTIKAGISYDPAMLEVTFMDSGAPFDPLAKEDPDTTMSAEDRKIGGLGIYMAKQALDETEYEYKDGQNVLTMRKMI